MESLCISGMMRAEIRHDGLDREAKSEAVGSKVNSRFTTGLVIALNMCLNCFSFCRVLEYPTSLGYLDAKYKQQLTKENTWGACEVATECYLFRIQTGSRPSSGIQGLVWMRPVLQPPVSFLCVRPQMRRTMAH